VGQAYFARTQTNSLSFNTVLLGSTATEIPYNDEIYAGSPFAPDSADFKVHSLAVPDAPAMIDDPNNPGQMIANPDYMRTNPDFMAGGRYGLNCGPVGGCTNRQVFPVPENIA